MKYSKPAIDIDQQIAQLKRRGLLIADESAAKAALQNISYYRLAGYWWPMQADKASHLFKPNSTFDNVIALYDFDRELRLLIFDVIERIEIAFRTRLIYHLSLDVSPWWFEDGANFKNATEHTETLLAIDRELGKTKEVLPHTSCLKPQTSNPFK